MIRSVLAILAGLVTLTVISFGIEAVTDPLLTKLLAGTLPPGAPLNQSIPVRVFMFLYGTLSITAGGYVTAWLARRLPLRHAAILGGVQFVMTLLAMATMWHHAPALTWVLTLLMTLPAALLGGWLFARRTTRGA